MMIIKQMNMTTLIIMLLVITEGAVLIFQCFNLPPDLPTMQMFNLLVLIVIYMIV